MSEPTPQFQPLDFCMRLSRAWLVLSRRLDNSLSSVHGLSFSDFLVLYHLQRAPGAKLRRIDLAERLGLTASGVTRSLLPLEKLGLLGRESDARDARVAYALLTDTGARLFNDALLTAQLVCAEATNGVPPDQFDALASVLGQLAGMNLSNS